jgi:nicotinate-nucleotide adenylyltransferase
MGIGACLGIGSGRLARVTHSDAASSAAAICLHIAAACVLASLHVPRAIHRDKSPGRRLAVLGGAFDPPHEGHVALARRALERFGLDRLLVLVVADPGHKDVRTPAETRLDLARLAFAYLPADVELDRHARTVDSLVERDLPRDTLFLIGADELAAFPTWKEPQRVLDLVRLGVATRPGYPRERLDAACAELGRPDRIEVFELEPHDVSSTEIRARAARGEPLGGLVPAAVAAEIARRNLYADA